MLILLALCLVPREDFINSSRPINLYNEKKKEISSQRQSNLQDEAQLSVPYKVSSLLLPRKKKLVFFLFTTLTLRKVRTVPEPEKKSRRDAKMRWDVIYNTSY